MVWGLGHHKCGSSNEVIEDFEYKLELNYKLKYGLKIL